MSGETTATDLPRVEFETVEFDDDFARVAGVPFTGVVVTLHPNGQKGEGIYRDGLPDGPQREWYSNGQLKREWIAIRSHGSSKITEWYESGQMKRRSYARFEWVVREQEWTERGEISRDERIELPEGARKHIAALERELNITSWPEEEESSRLV
jgi:antitoxin component YwqK of YwqJK toxin-antitoxin module